MAGVTGACLAAVAVVATVGSSGCEQRAREVQSEVDLKIGRAHV